MYYRCHFASFCAQAKGGGARNFASSRLFLLIFACYVFILGAANVYILAFAVYMFHIWSNSGSTIRQLQ